MEKEYYIKLNGENIPVTEEVYRAFKRPAWAERKRRKARQDRELSLEVFTEAGYDIPSGDAPMDEIVTDRLLLNSLLAALGKLNADELALIDALYYKAKSEREVAAEIGVPQTTINYRKKRLLVRLRKLMQNF